jgi:glycosyltransferase involved in cell wall biosynthesis
VASAGEVLIIVQNLPVPFDRRVWLEATTLCSAGYNVSIISPKGKDGEYRESYERREGIDIFRYSIPSEANGITGYIFEFAYCWVMTGILSVKVWLTKGFDVIHACNPPETYFLLALVYKFFGKKFIFDHHDLSPEMYLAKGKNRDFLYRGLLWLEYLTFKTANVIIATNQSHKEIAMKRGGVDEERIFVVRSGPDFDRLKILESEPDLKDGFPYLACYLGEMCPQDGVDYLLKAVKVYVVELGRHDTKFILIGGGSALEDLKELSSNLGLDSYVEFTGRISDHDLCRYLSSADLCLDPDPYTEWANQSTMNKIMEYMAFGKPVVAFDLKENRYSAQDAAVYAKPNDVVEFAELIADLLDDGDKQQAMGSVGLNRVRKTLAWEHSKPYLLAAYERVKES